MTDLSALCPCGSSRDYRACCGPYIAGSKPAPTAEALMRSRYSAYVKAQIPYLRETLAPEGREGFDEASARKWATGSKWLGLQIHAAEAGGPGDEQGIVNFTARYSLDGEEREHRELATFRRDPATRAWLFVDAKAPPIPQAVRDPNKVGRNDVCPCGSGMKFKKCCGA